MCRHKVSSVWGSLGQFGDVTKGAASSSLFLFLKTLLVFFHMEDTEMASWKLRQTFWQEAVNRGLDALEIAVVFFGL